MVGLFSAAVYMIDERESCSSCWIVISHEIMHNHFLLDRSVDQATFVEIVCCWDVGASWNREVYNSDSVSLH